MRWLFALLAALGFAKRKRPCPACGRLVRPTRVQPYVIGWSAWEDDWKCPLCGHKWMDRS